MARNAPQLTLKATGKLNNGGLNRLKDVMELQRVLYNSTLAWLQYRPETDPGTLRDLAGKELTQLRKQEPAYSNLLRKLSDATMERAITNHLRHAAPKDSEMPAGRPRAKSPERFRTISLFSPEHDVIFKTQPIGSTQKGSRLKFRTKGLPTIRLRTTQELPTGQQPAAVHVTLKHGRVQIRLVYDQPKHPRPVPIDQVNNPLGIDLGVALTVAASNGLTYTSPNEQHLTGQLKLAQRELSKHTAAAMRLKLCGFKAVLDEDNKQVLSERGRPRRELVWLQAPTRSFLKAKQTLNRLHEKRNSLRRNFRHAITSEIVKTALDQGKDLIIVEDLFIPNLTASAGGTAANPGRNVRAKSGLNRSILQQGWAEIISMLAYKARRAGLRLTSVWPARSSQTCSRCSRVDPKSRKSQAEFECTGCGHQDNADVNASRVIAQRGLRQLREYAAAAV